MGFNRVSLCIWANCRLGRLIPKLFFAHGKSLVIGVRCSSQRRFAHTPADDPNFMSIVDNPPILIRSGRRHGPGLIVLGMFSFSILCMLT